MSPRTPVPPSASRQPRRWCSPARVVIAVLIVTKVPRLRSAGWAAALGLLLAGAAGNPCDRLMRAPGIGRGAVAGFLDLQHFADFNIADSCLTCGAVLAVLLSPRGIPMTDQSPDHAERQDMGCVPFDAILCATRLVFLPGNAGC